MKAISPNTIHFLKNLSENNNREWYHAHKDEYQQARHDFEAFIEQVLQEVTPFYSLGMLRAKDCIYRQQRDIRFSHDKTPYTTHMSALIGPGGKKTTQVPFYLRIKPDGLSMLGAGAWEGAARQLHLIRQEIDYNPTPLKALISQPDFQQYFGTIQGVSLKRPPKGYAADHPDIDLIKMKEWYISHTLTETMYQANDFLDYVITVFRSAKPFVNYMNRALEEEVSLS